MDTVIQTTGWPRATTLYRYSIIICGAAALVSAPRWLSIPHFDLRFLFLVAVTILVSSRFAVQIPRVNTNVTVSDTFIFLVLLLYGGFAGIVLAAAEGLFSGLRISKTPVMIAFNSAMMACSTFLTVVVLRVFFGSVADLRTFELSSFIAAVGTMAMVQYFANTGFSAIGLALKTRESVWLTWQKHYLWTSITYLAGAAVAAATVNSFAKAGFTIFIVGAPVIAIIYFTYHKYLDEIKSTSAQAEQAERQRAEAERARAEAERERAEQAERHVEELNRHIAEQERISSQLKESKEHFRHAAFHDTLTNLPNRALLAENLKFVIERAKQHEDYQFAVLFLDLDRFKNVNDSLGHSIGDQLLIAMARRLESCTREADMVARLGGDEFAVLLDGIPDQNEAARMGQRIPAMKFLPPPASASRSVPRVTIIPRTCCVTPTPQCTERKLRARRATRFLTKACTHTRSICCKWRMTCVEQSSARSCESIISRSSRSTADNSPALRRWSAGSIPSAGSSTHQTSFPWPKTLD